MSQSVGSEVVSAMVGGMFSASALYPLEILKTRMQAESKAPKGDGDEGASPPDDDRMGRAGVCGGRGGDGLFCFA